VARLVPQYSPARTRVAQADSEAETLSLLQKELPEAYTVFHSVHWTRERSDTTAFGEIDFVIVNQSGQVLVIEQKNGAVEETPEGLVKDYGTSRKNLQTQIDRSISSIRKKYGDQHPGQGLIVDYLLYCPDYVLTGVNAAAIDRSRVVDARSRATLAQKVQQLTGPGSAADAAARERVLAFFRQSYEVVPDVGAHIASGERAYTRLSHGLLDIVRNLDFEPFRLRIQGVAGCGKTQVALHYLTVEASPEKPTLYVCFNRPLRDHMEELIPQKPGLLIETFHGLCALALEAAGNAPDFSRQAEPDFWKTLVEQVIGIDVPEHLKFARIIVDEGQDFAQEWWDVLQLFLRDDYQLLWLEDPSQNLQGRPPIKTPATVTYHATVSYRTPQSIAKFIAKTHGINFSSGIPVPGLGVGVHEYDRPEDQEKILNGVINKLRQTGFRNEDIAILTCSGLDRSPLYGLREIAGVPIRKFTREYTSDRRPVYTEGSLLFDSVHRFKGRQMPAVILTDVDPPEDASRAPSPLMLCGMTRAMTRLDMTIRKGGGSSSR
jgi:hypothetical protein